MQLLRLGPTRFTQLAWENLARKHALQIVSTEATNRAQFINELKSGKFSNVSYLTRTFESFAQTGKLDTELLDLIKKFTNIKAISHNGAGYDQVDADYCGKLNIQLSNVPNLVDDATADTAAYLILSTMRNFHIGNVNMINGKWPGEKCAGTPIGNDPKGKKLAILGMGGIGRAIRDRMKPFGFEIYYYNRNKLSPELENGAIYCNSKEELFKLADILSISIPLNEATKHCIDKNSINLMKDGVIIINTARGPVINEYDLKIALKNNKVGAFGSDVWDNEPNVDLEFAHMPNVVALPHLGTHSVETMTAMEEFVIENVSHYLETGRVKTMVPELKNLF